MLKTLILLIAIVFGIMQIIQIDVSIPENASTKTDFLVKYNPDDTIKSLIKNGCYDCHSYETKYKWYMHIAPVSWIVKGHVEDGRRHLNFSDWNAYDLKEKNHHLEECYEEIETYAMPMNSYISRHETANFTKEERQKLISWFKSLHQTATDSIN